MKIKIPLKFRIKWFLQGMINYHPSMTDLQKDFDQIHKINPYIEENEN
jgi:hypothetical protein